MAYKSDAPNQENISDMVDELNKLCNGESEDNNDMLFGEEVKNFSEDEVKELLKAQFIGEDAKARAKADDVYSLDEDFLAEAESFEEENEDSFIVDAEEPLEEIVEEQEAELEDIAPYSDEDEEDYEEEEYYEEDEDLSSLAVDIEENVNALEENSYESGILIDYAEEIDGELTFEQIEDTSEDDGIEYTHLELDAPEIDDELTFDQIEDTSDGDGIEYTRIELDAPEIDDELTFDQIEDTSDDGIEYTAIELDDAAKEADILESGEEVEGREQEIASMHLDLEPLENPIPEAQELGTADPAVETQDNGEVFQRIPEKAIMRQFAQESADKTAEQPERPRFVSAFENVPELCEKIAEGISNGEIVDELVEDEVDPEVEEETPLENLAKTQMDGAEISLLMQLGCDDEIIERYSREAPKTTAREELEAEGGEDDEPSIESKKITKEKLLSIRQEYKTKTISLLIRLGVCAAVSLLLLLYEGLSAMGVEFPGIMNVEDYFVSHVLIAMQLAVLCVLTSYKQIWEGAKKLLSPTPCAYSIAFILCASTLLYDFSTFFSGEGVYPPTFHLPVVFAIILAIVCEWRSLAGESRSFETFFEDQLRDDESSASKKFTLTKSKGKNSTAEKMYKGGLDSSKNVYYPIEIEKVDGFFAAANKTSSRTRVPMLMIIPVIALSIAIGVFALIASGEFWVGVGGMNLALLLALPTVATVASWLPFDLSGSNAQKSGYAFASEGSAEDIAGCDVAIFSDMHLFSKCTPSQVNIAFYDGTAKETVLACLNCVYKEVGGPMAEAFAAAGRKNMGKCRLTRVAKSGVEAIIGSNYSILVGSESFMARYGVSFPNVILNSKDDEVHTLCVSINGRATARIAVRYSVNAPFEMFVDRLAEQKISCVIETYDPMINAELLTKIRQGATTPISVVHLSAEDNRARRDESIERVLFEATEDELGLLARRSRFNLAVAMYTAKKMSMVRKYCNIISISGCALGVVLSFIMAAVGAVSSFNVFFVLLYWMLVSGGLVALILRLMPTKNAFSFDAYLAQKEAAKNTEKYFT